MKDQDDDHVRLLSAFMSGTEVEWVNDFLKNQAARDHSRTTASFQTALNIWVQRLKTAQQEIQRLVAETDQLTVSLSVVMAKLAYAANFLTDVQILAVGDFQPAATSKVIVGLDSEHRHP